MARNCVGESHDEDRTLPYRAAVRAGILSDCRDVASRRPSLGVHANTVQKISIEGHASRIFLNASASFCRRQPQTLACQTAQHVLHSARTGTSDPHSL